MQNNSLENEIQANVDHSEKTELKYPKWPWIFFTLSGLFCLVNFISMYSAAKEIEKITGKATWEIITSSLVSIFTGNPLALFANVIDIILNAPRLYELVKQYETARHYASIAFWACLVFGVLWIWRHNVYKNQEEAIKKKNS